MSASYWTLNESFAALITDGEKGVLIKGPIGRAGRSFVSTHATAEEAAAWAVEEIEALQREGYVRQDVVPHLIDRALHRHLVKPPLSTLTPRMVIRSKAVAEPFI